MTKKHFIAIAAAIRTEYTHANEAERLGMRYLTQALAAEFRRFNPNFDQGRFLDAAYRDGFE